MITIESFLFQSVPEAIVFTAFALAMAGYMIRDHLMKVLLAGFVSACIAVSLWFLEVPFYVRFLLQIPLLWIVHYFVFRYRFSRVMITITISMGVIIIAETISIEAVTLVTYLTFDDLINSNLLRIIVPSGGYTVLILSTYILNRKRWSLFRGNSFSQEVRNKKVDLYIFALIAQLLIVVMFNLSLVNGFYQQSVLLFNIMTLTIVTLTLLLLFFVQYLISSAEKAGELEAHKDYLKSVEELFVTIRGQRHDFINHIQVLNSYMKLKKYDLLDEYISNLTTDVREISKVLVPDNPTLSALLQTKSVLFERDEILFMLDLKGDLSKIPLDKLDQVKVLGNLLDNAKEAILQNQVQVNKRKISLVIIEQANEIQFKVSNLEPILSKESIARMFEIGYTTKENHTGIGLAIVNQIVTKYRGCIKVCSSHEEGTVFEITIPKEGAEFTDEGNLQRDSGTYCETLQ
ncbi:hypothetical protein BHU72_01415 [Desulfuribacillus stibiiarsenatis]|uniref:histidine kinase n=1 Tax=Desulfuribacillus stibiiarsenatis TaxID=1390249 RepID=A0A1E5LA49_9FIRM|nr:Spo0B domain-containing protein [Desulfuribacillus stibiiarsenatis]OEH86944.1 hypothetical protein BHU72_01415 [Desulfuribacillus stibiiarsenatis]